ncbi:PH domain-containing protein [Lacticaseibacillus mingshuiensis]|uniref:PH domain-containing protein n=1 Tax=Lacticaseibacillus mingshuiensis TaxID=2799574 RepID=UPI00194E4FA0|nr:PH domain-containing protein [Lacticaseibacillus mingshuiensis]
MKGKHLAPLALVGMGVKELRSAFWAVVAVLALASKLDWWTIWLGLIVVAIIVITVIAVAVRYWRFTYLVGDDGLTINSGLFEQKTQHIPYSRIQTVQRQQWFFLRPFRLESLTIETASHKDEEAEASLLAVPVAVGDQIEALRTGKQPTTAPAKDPEAAHTAELAEALQAITHPEDVAADPTYQINAHDLNLYALSSVGFVPIIVFLLALWQRLPDDAMTDAANALAHLAFLVVVALVIGALLLGLMVTYLSILLKFYHFTLTRSAQQLTTARGYFKRNTVSVRSAHVQAVRIKQSILRQWLHLATVQVLIASNAGQDEDDDELVLMPVLRDDAALTTMQPYIDWLPEEVPDVRRVPAGNRWLFIRNAVLIWAGILLAGGLAVGIFARTWLAPYLVLAAVILLFGFFQGRYVSRSAGVAIVSPDLLMLETGHYFTRERFLVRRANVQAVELAQSIWMKKPGRAHLTVNVRKGNSNEAIEVRYLDLKTASAVRDWFTREK